MRRPVKFLTQMERFKKKVHEAEYREMRIKRLACRMRNVRYPWENRFRALCKVLGHEP